MGYDDASQIDSQLNSADALNSKLQTDSYGQNFSPVATTLLADVDTSASVLPKMTIADFDLDDESDTESRDEQEEESEDKSEEESEEADESTETFCDTDGKAVPTDRGAELLKKFEAQSPEVAKKLGEVARQTVSRLREGLEGKVPASAEDKRRGIEAINKLGDAVRSLKNPDGSRMSYNDRTQLVAAMLNREMARVGLGDYKAIPSPARPRSGEFIDYRIQKTGEKEGDRSLSVTVPFSTLAGVRSEAASISTGVKTRDSHKEIDVWTRKK